MADKAIKLFITNQIDLNRFSKATASKVIDLFDQVLVDLLNRINSGYLDLNSPTNLERLNALYRQTLNSLLTVIDAASLLTEQQLNILADNQLSYASKYLSYFINKDIIINSVILSPIFVKNIVENNPTSGIVLSRAFKTIATNTANNIDKAIRVGLIQGETNQQITKRIRGSKANNYADGIYRSTRANIQTLVRTAVTDVAAQASQEIYKANSAVTNKYKYIATLDSRTSNTCISLDNKIFEYGQGPLPPQNLNCRSSIIPVIDYKALGIEGPKTPLKRASKDGPVSASLNYAQWLREQPNNVVEYVLGKAKAKLFLQGTSLDKIINT